MRKIIVANWKMNPKSIKDALVILKGLLPLIKGTKNTDVIICPPFPFLSIYQKIKSKTLKLGAQNVAGEVEGPYTGEVSASMLRSFNVSYVIIGHSERRLMGEINTIVNKKILNALKGKLMPILCVGESKRDAEGFYLSFIKHQIIECLASVPKPQLKNIVIAYEPIWAIGKGAVREATPEEFTEIKIFIKKIISDLYDIKAANAIQIIYGGSVNTLNAESFLTLGGADGLLVGRDSLNPKKLGAIIKFAQ